MKRRVLICCNGLYGGGAERVLATVVHNLSPDRFDITLYDLHQEKIDSTWPTSIHYRFLYSHPSENAGLLRKLQSRMRNKLIHLVYRYFSPRVFYRLFIRGQYDVEIAFIEGYATRIISGSPNQKSNKIAWVHIDLEKEHWSKIAYRSQAEEGEAYGAFDTVVCVSKTVKDSVLSLFPTVRNALVIYNPIDDVEIVRKSKIEGGSPALIRRKHTFISVGRMVPQKGFDRLLKVVRKLITEGYDIALNILGDGIEREKFESYIQEHKLQHHVQLMKYVSNPYPLIAQSDIVVCASRAEGFSTVITESLILGKPIVSTNCAGVEEQLGTHGEYGLLTENDPQALYEGIKQVLDTPDFIDKYHQKMQLKGKMFSLAESMKQIRKLLMD